jgi:hypothetical protein
LKELEENYVKYINWRKEKDKEEKKPILKVEKAPRI